MFIGGYQMPIVIKKTQRIRRETKRCGLQRRAVLCGANLQQSIAIDNRQRVRVGRKRRICNPQTLRVCRPTIARVVAIVQREMSAVVADSDFGAVA